MDTGRQYHRSHLFTVRLWLEDLGEVRAHRASPPKSLCEAGMAQNDGTTSHDRAWQTLAEFTLTGEPGSESLAAEGVIRAVRDLHLPSAQLERLKAIVAEAALNARQRYNDLHRPGTLMSIRVLTSNANVTGRQGWGFFLIERAINDARTTRGRACYVIEVFLYLEGDRGG